MDAMNLRWQTQKTIWDIGEEKKLNNFWVNYSIKIEYLSEKCKLDIFLVTLNTFRNLQTVCRQPPGNRQTEDLWSVFDFIDSCNLKTNTEY